MNSVSIPEHARVVVVAGLTGPELIQECLKQSPSEGRLHLILDPAEGPLRQRLDEWGLIKLLDDRRFAWFLGTDHERFATFVLSHFNRRDRMSWLGAVSVQREPSAWKENARDLENLLRDFEAQRNLIKKFAGFKADGLMGLKYLLGNLRWMESTPGIARLKGLTKGKPAIIASTGPSLAKSLPLLKELASKAVIFSPDASLKVLLSAGIAPHIVCTLEREMASKPFFESLGELPRSTSPHLVAYPVVPNEVITAYPGPHWVAFRAYRQHYFFNEQLKRGILMGGHSVAHMCVTLADFMECDPIVLVGQDLAFDPETLATHSKNVAYDSWSKTQSEAELRKMLQEEGDELYWRPGNQHEQVPTRGYYIVFAREFGVMAQELRARVYNCTEGGLKIPGLSWKPLQEISKSWVTSTSDLFEILNRLHSEPIAENEIKFEQLIDHLKLLDRRIDQDLAVAQHLQNETILKNLLATWQALQKDHVCEGFALEILGEQGVELEILVNDALLEADLDVRVKRAIPTLCHLLREIQAVLAEVLGMIEKKIS